MFQLLFNSDHESTRLRSSLYCHWKVVFTLSLMLLPFFGINQDTYFQKIDGERGLPTPTIFDLFVSGEGYLYMGTEIGLVRFNGISFSVLPVVDNFGRAMSSIQQSSDGTIWCKNFTNQIFFLENDTLQAAEQINSEIIKSGQLKEFIVLQNGTYFLTEKTLFLKSKNNKITKVLALDETKVKNSFIDLAFDHSRKQLCVIDIHALYKLKPNHEVLSTIVLTNGQNTAEFHDNKLVVSLKGDLFSISIDGTRPNFLKNFKDTYINRITVIGDELWICTNSGLLEYNATSKSFNRMYFENTRITDIAKDFQGGYWVSSIDRGLFYMPNKNIKSIKTSDYSIYRVTPGPDQSFFLGMGNGEILHYSKKGTLIKALLTDFVSEIEYLFYDNETMRLISSHGIFQLKDSYAYTPIRLGKSIAKDNKGNFLLNTYNQAILLNQNFRDSPQLKLKNPEKYKFEAYSNWHVEFHSIYDNRSKSGVYDAASNSFFIAGFDALYKVSYDGKRQAIRFNNENVVVSHIAPLRDGGYLLSTQKYGLLLLNKGALQAYRDITNGLSSNVCLKSIEHADKVYVLTEQGIDEINKSNQKVHNLSLNLSLTNLNILDFVVMDNTILLATDLGLLHYLLQDEINPTLPLLNKLAFFNSQGSRPLSSNILSYKENSVAFIADAIHFLNNGDFTFQYRLLGLDSVWYVQPSSENKFNYFSLPPGNYTFELKMELNGFESAIYTKSFRIKKAFWQTAWFYILLLGLLCLTLYYLFRRVLLQQRRKAENEQRLLQSQLTSLRAQMNPHFLFNIMNSVQGLIYANKKKEASEMLGKMSALIRNVLELSSQETIALHREIELLQSYVSLEAARFEEDFNYTIDVNVTNEDLDRQIPSMIVQPFVENAIKHGLLHNQGQKTLEIRINKGIDKQIVIIIEDNGIGRKASAEINAKRTNHQSFSTEAIATRIDLINTAHARSKIAFNIEDIENNDKQPKGTKVTLIITTDE